MQIHAGQSHHVIESFLENTGTSNETFFYQSTYHWSLLLIPDVDLASNIALLPSFFIKTVSKDIGRFLLHWFRLDVAHTLLDASTFVDEDKEVGGTHFLPIEIDVRYLFVGKCTIKGAPGPTIVPWLFSFDKAGYE